MIIRTKETQDPGAIFSDPRAHPSLTVGEASASLPRGGTALCYADNFGPVSPAPD